MRKTEQNHERRCHNETENNGSIISGGDDWIACRMWEAHRTKMRRMLQKRNESSMVTDSGDITDQSFNQMTYEACKAWGKGK